MQRAAWPETKLTSDRGLRGLLAFAFTLAVSSAVNAEPSPDLAVIVHVHNDAPVASWLLHSAEQETTRIFRQMGVELLWREHRAASSDDDPAPEVSIVLMSAAMGARKSQIEHIPDGTLGRGSRRTGRAYVFCDRVSAVANRHGLVESLILARTLTHELGHLIANVGHDTSGAMRDPLELTNAGFFGFTDAQQRAIRKAIADAMATNAPQLALRLAP